ncbi:unnamed protein product [Rotaria sordida]|nr:unnamed protein product [Rotaria sordida]
MPIDIAALLVPAVIKGVTSAASAHAFKKIVEHHKRKKHYHKTQQQQQPSSYPSDYSDYIYQDAWCDGCGKFVSDDIRYYCLQCPNFDLCENCNSLPYIVTSTGVHYRNHRMLQMIQEDEEPFDY